MIKVDVIGLGRDPEKFPRDYEPRIEVKFLVGMSPYNAGEEAAFEIAYAHKLVERGYARYVDLADEPQPEPIEEPEGPSEEEKAALASSMGIVRETKSPKGGKHLRKSAQV